MPVSEPEPPDRIAATLPPPDSDVSAMSETEVSLEGSEEELVGSRRAMATVSSWATVAEAGGGASEDGGTVSEEVELESSAEGEERAEPDEASFRFRLFQVGVTLGVSREEKPPNTNQLPALIAGTESVIKPRTGSSRRPKMPRPGAREARTFEFRNSRLLELSEACLRADERQRHRLNHQRVGTGVERLRLRVRRPVQRVELCLGL